MAAIQAWIAVVASRNSRHRRLDRGPCCSFRTSPAGSTRADMTVTLENMTRTVDGIPTIRNVSLTLERGTLSVLLGPTLSGKTSIMRLLAGLDKPTTGRVLVDGKDVTGIDVRQRSVAMVYQQFINYPSLTVYENIASPLRVQGRPREEIDKRVQEAAKLLRLEPFLNRTPLQLSGGQQQRTAIARALVKGADLVLLDEPLANLDYKLREELRTELPRMWEGEILQAGETSKVYRHPDTLRVAQVFSDPPLNIVGIEKRDGAVQYAGGVQAPASGTAPTGSVFARISSRWPTALPAATRFTPPSR